MNPAWGYRRIHGELLVLGIKIAASTVWQILQDAGIDPAPERTTTTWSAFLHSQADALPACDFFETSTLSGTRLYVLAVIEHASPRIRILGATAHPTASRVTQAAGNLVMDLEDEGRHARFLIRDRDGKFPALFDDILADTGIQVLLTGVRIPRMNSTYSTHYASTRSTTTPTDPTKAPTTHDHYALYHHPSPDQTALTHLDIRQRQRLGGILNEYHHTA